MDNLPLSIQKPGRYLASEVNACRKDFDRARTRFLLAFPDLYEVGMSHLGLHVLYHLLNGLEGVMADRAYAPWHDCEALLRSRGEPLRAHESRRPLRDFDFVGFSLQYELSYTNILTMLDLGGIPFHSKDRGPTDPWVIAGGPCAFNPEPLAEFLDFVVLGEAEEVLVEIVDLHREWRGSRADRQGFLRAVAEVPGVYVPSFFDVTYEEPHGVIRSIEPRLRSWPVVRKRLVMDLDRRSPTPVKPLVPMGDIVHNRLSLEIARGCTRGCRFCQAGYIYRPVRERHPAEVLASAVEALKNSGFEELSLLSFSTGDYCQIQPLLSALVDRLEDARVAVSLPSMRVGTLTPELMELVRRVRKTGFTLAPEAGSERLRRVINKPVTDDDLLQAAQNAFSLGWKVLKLYFMIGLPTEDDNDLESLIRLTHRVWQLAGKKRASLNVSVSTFVPKPHTPFQWHPQLSRSLIEDRIDVLRGRMNRPGLKMKWNDADQSILEAVFSRGDRRLGRVIERAYGLGARFDGWGEQFQPRIWARAFEEAGLEPCFYAERARGLDEVLPWRHLSSGVESGFLLEELERSLRESLTPDCRWEACSACGVCDHRTVFPQLHEAAAPSSEGPHGVAQARKEGGQFLFLLQYSRVGDLRYHGQLEIARSLIRAVRRAGLPAVYSSGFHPHLKLSFEEALPLGMESLVERAILTLSRKLDPEQVRQALNGAMPAGLRVEKAELLKRRPERAESLCVTYRVTSIPSALTERLARDWDLRPDGVLFKETKRGRVSAPLWAVLLDLRRIDQHTIEMDVMERKNLCFRPSTILIQLLPEQSELLHELRVCKMSISPRDDDPMRPISFSNAVEGRCSPCPPRSS
ncbi:MAG: TIGR03960 family B12-binding radical SAM protein [Syntrophobacteraceae bacterium]|jgi:radical SAM family uncharacterized protein/radical SAM-linked protein|nr:TIGR03960 family B12-binding radical SAM protein [Syntrophobacteraceae bacterium]